jgi:hypothetical protein
MSGNWVYMFGAMKEEPDIFVVIPVQSFATGYAIYTQGFHMCSLEVLLQLCCWIQFAIILLRIFPSIFIKEIGL